MPRRVGTPIVPLESLDPAARLAADDGTCQLHWYRHAAFLAVAAGCRTALDVGAGLGLGVDVLRAAGLAVAGIDPGPLRGDIILRDVSDVCDAGYDLVVACDVLEHVEDDAGFLRHLLRVARKAVFLSTPNWTYSRCGNPHHVREYLPAELETLLIDAGVRAWFPFSSGVSREVVAVPTLSAAINNFGVWIPK